MVEDSTGRRNEFIRTRLVPRRLWARAVQRTVLHRIARGSAQGHSHCADHKPLDPGPSQPPECHGGRTQNAKRTWPLWARRRAGKGPGPGRPPCSRTGRPLGAALGWWSGRERLRAILCEGQGSLRAMRWEGETSAFVTIRASMSCTL
jgi:hypothetical protein